MRKKQLIGIMMAMIVTASLAGCGNSESGQTETNPPETTAAVPSASVLDRTADGEKGTEETESEHFEQGEMVAKVIWEHAGDLEPQIGTSVNKGTAGLLAGLSNGYIVVGGGANFPEDGPEAGGAKKHYPDIYVLKQEDGQLVQVSHTTLDHEIGYGASITTPDGIYYVGGSPEEGQGNKILLVKADKSGQITTEEVGTLPFTFSDGSATLKDDIIYIGAGKQDQTATNRFFAFELKTKETKELAPMPGEATRTQCVSQILGDFIYVFSGGDKVAYTDGYRYNIASNEWEPVSDVQIGDEKISLLGAGSVKLNDHMMMVVGGFNKEVYDNAVAQMAELKDEALVQFKQGYFGADPSELKWNRNMLVYDSDTNIWTTVGEVPFDAPCGEGLILDGNKIYSVNGEIKPGTRTNHMYSGTIEWK